MLGVLAVLTFAYSGGGAAGADSMAVKWLSPAASGEKESNRTDTGLHCCRPEDLFENLRDVSWEERGRRRPGCD